MKADVDDLDASYATGSILQAAQTLQEDLGSLSDKDPLAVRSVLGQQSPSGEQVAVVKLPGQGDGVPLL